MENEAPSHLIIRHGERRPKSWYTFSRRLIIERGSCCEACSQGVGRMICHHVLEYALYPQFRKTPGNIVVLCDRCHSSATSSERFPQDQALHYSRMPNPIRERISVFLREHAPSQTFLLRALATGWDFWPGDWPR